MSCTGEGFEQLTDRCVDFRARAEACELRLPVADARAGQLEGALRACEARPVSAAPIPAPAWRPIVTLALGVAGTAAIAASVAASSSSDGLRLGVGAAGAASLAGGLVLAVWP